MSKRRCPRKLHSILLLGALLSPNVVFAFEIVAHRGYGCGDEENTIDSIRRAWQARVDVVELDVRISADGIVYLFHDDELTGDPVAGQSLADLQQQTDYFIPSLAMVFEMGTPPGAFLLDLKDEERSDFEPLVELISSSGFPQERLMIQSAEIGVLAELQRSLPAVNYYYMSRLERRPPLYLKPRPSSIITAIDGYNFSGVSLKGRRFLGHKFIRTIQDAGYKVNVWTINDLERANHYGRSGVDAIITDRVVELAASESLCASTGQT